ncbi:MAG: hypothetical protein AAF769_00630 [Pseudomonadota bacterium]
MNLNTTLIVAAVALLGGCAATPPPCDGPTTRNLDAAVMHVKDKLATGCTAQFDGYFDTLLTTAEGNPRPENKRVFSEFLVWTADQGLLSQRQAKDYYNRFFNVKFMTLESDYNTCSHTCPRRDRVLLDMERELSDKERGLLRVSRDDTGYYRADRLYKEVELVLEATCTACAAGR